MTDFLDEDWGRAPVEKPQAAADPARPEDRQWESVFQAVLGSFVIVERALPAPRGRSRLPSQFDLGGVGLRPIDEPLG